MRNFWVVLFLFVPVLGTGVFIIAAAVGAWLPDPISTIASDIDHLFYVILGITGFFFIATEVLLAYAMFKGRPRADGKGHYLHGNHNLEIIWTVGTAGILLFIAIYQMPTWMRAKYRSRMPGAEAAARNTPVQYAANAGVGKVDAAAKNVGKHTDVLVTGSQFLWQVRYPLWDDKANQPKKLDTRFVNPLESFELVNELHVPVGEPVVVHLTTRDVIHSFYLPNVRVKQDALPGHMIPVWFSVDAEMIKSYAEKYGAERGIKENEPIVFEWLCAELCGWGHYRMRGKLVVHRSKQAFDDWLKQQTQRHTGMVAGAN